MANALVGGRSLRASSFILPGNLRARPGRTWRSAAQPHPLASTRGVLPLREREGLPSLHFGRQPVGWTMGPTRPQKLSMLLAGSIAQLE